METHWLIALLLALACVVAIIMVPALRRASQGGKWERKLRQQCRGDEALLSRLLERELAHPAGKTREQAAQAALEKLQRDNR